MSNTNPSIDPADEDNLAGGVNFMFKKAMQSNVNNMLPCRVIDFDRNDPQRVIIEHVITILKTDGTVTQRGQLANIPVLQLGGGGFVLTFPLKTGDFGWIKACDRDISNFLSTYASAQPQTTRQFNFSDGVFIPDVMRGYTVESEDAENAVLRSLDGTVKISIGLDKITYKAPLHVFDGPVQFNDPIAMEGGMTATGGGSNSVIVNGSLFVEGNQRVDGSITAGGSITPDVPP
jgi:hypothetical protein